MSSPLNVLLEMGFPQNKAEKALNLTGNVGAEAAMEWLLAHSGDPDPDVDEPMPSETASATSTSESLTDAIQDDNVDNDEEDTDLVAKSLKCEDCGKLLRSEADVEFHASKTGHQNFSETTDEIKPLSDEEKKEQLRKLEDRIKMRRMEKEAQEKREQIEREKQRRKTGQEITEARKKLDDEKLKEAADQRRREKIEEKMARQRVLDQIEKDKQARKAKFGGSSSQSSMDSKIPIDSPTSPASVPAAPQQSSQKEYDQTKLQIRLPSGQSLTQTFGSKEELAAVRLFVKMNSQNDMGENFSMMTNFPRHVFVEEDMEKPLVELGLVPSAVITITKGQS